MTSAPINLDKIEKGQKIDLTKGNSFNRFYFGLSWKAPTTVGGHKFDCDVTAILLGSDGKILNGDTSNFVYYGLAKNEGEPFQHHTGCVMHTGDVQDGDKDGDDEVLIVDTSLIPDGTDEISIIVTIHEAVARNNQNFGVIKDAAVHIHVAGPDNKPVVGSDINYEFDLNENYSLFTALQVGSVYKKNGEWKFDPVGQGFKADLRGVLEQYGARVK